MTEAAIILCQNQTAASVRKISRLLEFFGVKARLATTAKLFAEIAAHAEIQFRVLGSVEDFFSLAADLETQPEWQQLWKTRVQSGFCHGENDGEQLAKLFRKWNAGVKIRQASQSELNLPWKFSEKLKDFCGPFAGLSISSQAGDQPVWLCEHGGQTAEAMIASRSGTAFLRMDFFGVSVFLSTQEVIDIDAPLPGRNFDIKRYLLSAVPVVLYLKSELATTGWQPPETTACVVIDDPLLRPRYGFLNYDRLLGLMERLNFSSNIAFIPWNWKRSSRTTVQLFRENAARFSLSVHGCDHTNGEYGSLDRERLAWKSQQSLERMGEHRRRTGLPHDSVMVFPQGVFSKTAMAVLKVSNFIGTVNSEVISTDPQPPQITIADFWNVAVMNYSDFPIFTRRYPWAGTANFAFDILLGKPCLVNLHHNDFHDHDHCVTECVTQLNHLNAKLRWTNLTEVVRRSYRQRQISPALVEVEIFGHEVRLDNPGQEKKTFRVFKQESAPETLREIRVAGQPANWTSMEKRITFETTLAPGESKMVVLSFKPISLEGVRGEGLAYQTKVRVRRYLCEVRDNYLMRKSFSE